MQTCTPKSILKAIRNLDCAIQDLYSELAGLFTTKGQAYGSVSCAVFKSMCDLAERLDKEAK